MHPRGKAATWKEVLYLSGWLRMGLSGPGDTGMAGGHGPPPDWGRSPETCEKEAQSASLPTSDN